MSHRGLKKQLSPGNRARRSAILGAFLLAVAGGYELDHNVAIGWTLIGVAIFIVPVVAFTRYRKDRRKKKQGRLAQWHERLPDTEEGNGSIPLAFTRGREKSRSFTWG